MGKRPIIELEKLYITPEILLRLLDIYLGRGRTNAQPMIRSQSLGELAREAGRGKGERKRKKTERPLSSR